MKNYFEEIKRKLSEQIKIEMIEVIDNSDKHKSHKFFDPQKLHLHLKIKSIYLLFFFQAQNVFFEYHFFQRYSLILIFLLLTSVFKFSISMFISKI